MILTNVLTEKIQKRREQIEILHAEIKMLVDLQSDINDGVILELKPTKETTLLDVRIIETAKAGAYTDVITGCLAPNLIHAIKEYRSNTGKSLKESKDYCEALFTRYFGQKPWRIS